jgi:hypothetical protein
MLLKGLGLPGALVLGPAGRSGLSSSHGRPVVPVNGQRSAVRPAAKGRSLSLAVHAVAAPEAPAGSGSGKASPEYSAQAVMIVLI